MLGASIHYPLRGAVTWKSIVGTNVAADALSNLSSPGVTGGVLIVVGEDYGEGASVIQERTHAYAIKSGILLLDPRPDLAQMVDMVEHGFAMSEASNMPAMMELRIRACHVRGSFTARDNRAPAISTRALMDDPARFSYDKLAHPPVTFRHEKLKYDERIPAARRYIVEHGRNLEKKVYAVPVEIDRRVAELKLASMGLEIEKLTPEQDKYLHSWQMGT